MSITRVLGGSSEQTTSMEEMLRRQAEKQLNAEQKASEGDKQTSVIEAVRSANTNVMGNNFSSSGSQPSRYIEASLGGVQAQIQQKRAMTAQIWAESDELGGMKGGARKHMQSNRLRKELEKANEEIRAEIERKAKEGEGKQLDESMAKPSTRETAPVAEQVSVDPAQDPRQTTPALKFDSSQINLDIKV